MKTFAAICIVLVLVGAAIGNALVVLEKNRQGREAPCALELKYRRQYLVWFLMPVTAFVTALALLVAIGWANSD